MFKIDFYRDKNGKSEVEKFINYLKSKSETDKNAQIQYDKISMYFSYLREKGTNLPKNIAKHIEGDIWELRPQRNRIFYFYYENNTFVMLSYFLKKSQKTPKREIKKAKSNKNKYLKQKGKIKNGSNNKK